MLRLATEPDRTRAQVLQTAGYLAHHTGDYDRAATLLDQSVTLWRQVGSSCEVALAVAQRGRLEQSRGNLDQAWQLLTESRALFDAAGGEVVFDAPLAVFLAQVAKDRGDHERAIPLFVECLALARGDGDKHTESSVLRSLGELRQIRRDITQARSHFAESLKLILELDDHACAVTGLNVLATLEVEQGNVAPAVRLFAAAKAICELTGYVPAPELRARWSQAMECARSLLHDNDEDEAIWNEGHAMSMEQAITYALAWPTSTR
jgi:tetratricopeptide (TPR) repeat protein